MTTTGKGQTVLTLQSANARKRHLVVFLRIRGIRARVGTWTYGGEGSPVRCPLTRTWCAWVECGGRLYGRQG